jgi:hypothetical protein
MPGLVLAKRLTGPFTLIFSKSLGFRNIELTVQIMV